MPKELERVEVRSRAALRAWLSARHTQAESVWLVTFKKGHPDYLPYVELVEELLCFGWIDGQAQTVDAERTMRLCAPRRRGSGWSGVNKGHIRRLLAAGLMAPAGLARIEEAKQSGDWTLLDAASALELPADLQAALAERAGAEALWAALPASTRRATLEWITLAKRPETRARRVEEAATRTAAGERPR
jgi:uncharacterized protein YdeI (YjbR/CyaY-like superfamily)